VCYCTETLKVHQPAHLLYNPNTLTRGSTDKSYPRFSLDEGFDPRWSFGFGMGYLRIGSDARLKWRNIGAFRWERDIVMPCWRVSMLEKKCSFAILWGFLNGEWLRGVASGQIHLSSIKSLGFLRIEALALV